MKTIAPLFIGAAIALVACGRNDPDQQRPARPALGRAEQQAPSETARYADGNRDGKVTRAEAQADPMLSASFDRYDTDDNDELDRGEFARLEARAADPRGDTADGREPERSTLRPRNEFPHPAD